MELSNEFVVEVSPEAAWEALTDVPRIAPCMPGAELQSIDGETFKGVVKVKVGPITAQYKGEATFIERDEVARKVVLRAQGRETKGQGNAAALVTATLAAEGSGTRVTIATDLTVTGRVAQFGRGVMADVSAKLLEQFVECLETEVLAPQPEEPAADAEVPIPPPAPQPVEPIDLLDAAGGAVGKRAGVIAAVAVGLIVLIRLLTRGRRRTR